MEFTIKTRREMKLRHEQWVQAQLQRKPDPDAITLRLLDEWSHVCHVQNLKNTLSSGLISSWRPSIHHDLLDSYAQLPAWVQVRDLQRFPAQVRAAILWQTKVIVDLADIGGQYFFHDVNTDRFVLEIQDPPPPSAPLRYVATLVDQHYKRSLLFRNLVLEYVRATNLVIECVRTNVSADFLANMGFVCIDLLDSFFRPQYTPRLAREALNQRAYDDCFDFIGGKYRQDRDSFPDERPFAEFNIRLWHLHNESVVY